MRYFILLILLLTTFGISAQSTHTGGAMSRADMMKEAVIKGTVIDDLYKTPVKFANVILFSTKDSSVVEGVVCDENGFFEMSGMAFGKYYILIDFIGYEKVSIEDIKIQPKLKERDLGNIYLKHLAENIDEVEIVAERNFVEYKIDRKVINISKNINASGGTIVDALENAPSIQVDMDGNVTMRGSSNFKVLIDGKPSILDANDILQQIPASSVENIEIITNPSVKYDPDGTTGILNIIMKKEHKTGFSGIINASIGTGDKYNADFLFNYRAEKANFYFGANYGDRTHAGTGESLRKTFLSNDTNYLFSESERDHRRNYYSVKGGVDLYLNKKNTLSLSGRYGFFGFGMGTYSLNHSYTYPNTIDTFSISDGLYDVGGNFYSTNIYFKHDFSKKGHELIASADYSKRTGDNETGVKETYTDQFFNETNDFTQYRSLQDRGREVLRLKVDYTFPLNKNTKLESGYQSRFRNAGGDYRYEDLIAGIWTPDDTYSNEMDFLRNIHSIYTSVSGNLIGIGYMLGLRGEYTDRIIDQKTTGDFFEVKRFDFFPSVHLSKDLPKLQQLQLSYSRRIERPRHWYLNPFPGYSDAYSVRIGNPELLPEYIDSYELSYQKRIKQSFFNLEAYYRQKNNKINRIQELLDDGKLLYTFDNIDKEYSYGTEISANIQLYKWWTVYANANFYRYNIEGDIAGITTDFKSINYDFRMNTTFMFSKNSRIQLNGFYNAPTVTAQGEREGFYFFGAAYRHEFFKKRLSLVINARDIFRTGKYVFTSEGEGFVTENEMLREAPVITLSLSYKINNYKQKRGEREDDMNDLNEGGM